MNNDLIRFKYTETNLILDELFAARKGNGATKNGEKITVNDTKEISKSLIITEFGSSRDDKILDIVLENMKSTILTPSR
jgi:myo-inositol-1(or 4)-monophosphatase